MLYKVTARVELNVELLIEAPDQDAAESVAYTRLTVTPAFRVQHNGRVVLPATGIEPILAEFHQACYLDATPVK